MKETKNQSDNLEFGQAIKLVATSLESIFSFLAKLNLKMTFQ